MNEFNLYKDIKDAIKACLSLVQKYGFNLFEEQQLAYEYHFITKNHKGDCIDISFEAVSSSPIWVQINNVYLENIFADKQLENLDNQLNALYKDNFEKYLKLDDQKYLGRNIEIYKTKGKALNAEKINRVFEILKDDLESLIIKSENFYQTKEEIMPLSKTLVELQELSKTKDFRDYFNEFEKLIIETDKCEIEIHSIDELNEMLVSLSERNVENLEWAFEK